jgi:polar amino acid transport system substrate-binding protein
MRYLFTVMLVAFAMTSLVGAQHQLVWTNGTVRAAYLASNPAQAVKDPNTGEPRGVVVDLTQELARTRGVKVTLLPLPNPQAVIDAVRNGNAEIGFVAYNPERAGPVEFSQVYLLVNQTFLVRDDSPIRSIRDIDQQGRKLGATRADSIALYLRRTLKQGQLVELDNAGPDAVMRMLGDGTIDAFGANRQRLTDMARGAKGVRLLADDLYGVEQTIIVPGGRNDALEAVNQFIDEVRGSGLLQKAIERSGVVGISAAPQR